MNLTEEKVAIWKGRQITYRPGRLSVALKKGAQHKTAYNILVRAGCIIEYDTLRHGVFEVVVPPQDTLRLAGVLSINPIFRYVEPDVVEKESYD